MHEPTPFAGQSWPLGVFSGSLCTETGRGMVNQCMIYFQIDSCASSSIQHSTLFCVFLELGKMKPSTRQPAQKPVNMGLSLLPPSPRSWEAGVFSVLHGELGRGIVANGHRRFSCFPVTCSLEFPQSLVLDFSQRELHKLLSW